MAFTRHTALYVSPLDHNTLMIMIVMSQVGTKHYFSSYVHTCTILANTRTVHFQSRPQSPWDDKYQVKGKSLSLTQIRNYGRQVLEVNINTIKSRHKVMSGPSQLKSFRIQVLDSPQKDT